MITGTVLIVLIWTVFKSLGLPLVAGIILTVVSGLWILFCMLFGVYFFNLDMKLTSKLQPLFIKHYEKRKREHKI